MKLKSLYRNIKASGKIRSKEKREKFSDWPFTCVCECVMCPSVSDRKNINYLFILKVENFSF